MMAPSGHRRTGVRFSTESTGRRTALGILAGVALFLIAVAAVSCDDSSPSATPSPPATAEPATTPSPEATAEPATSPTPEAPSDTVWLCRPGLAGNPCEGDLTTTVVLADGTSTTEVAAPAKAPPIDCFYVYPTVSEQPTVNANLEVDPAQTTVAIQQAARFSQVCGVYAPIYRQLTLSNIGRLGEVSLEARELAYGDVVSAWQDYLSHYNDGRGVVLIGHSQGTGMLSRLIALEIEPNPDALGLLVSALLIGGNVTVAAGEDVGGDFQSVPACRSAGQTGCVVAYSAFIEPPPSDSGFGRVGAGPGSGLQTSADVEVLCVNPASLSGGTGPLEPYFAGTPLHGVFGADLIGSPPAPTAWLAYPGLYTAQCESSGDANWLQVDATDIAGDERWVVEQTLGPTWGLHLVDINIALGNLVDLVRQQAAAYSQ